MRGFARVSRRVCAAKAGWQRHMLANPNGLELEPISESLMAATLVLRAKAKEEADAKTGRLGEADDASNSPAKPRPVRVWAKTGTRGSALLGS